MAFQGSNAMLSRRRATALVSANWWDGGRLEHLVRLSFMNATTSESGFSKTRLFQNAALRNAAFQNSILPKRGPFETPYFQRAAPSKLHSSKARPLQIPVLPKRGSFKSLFLPRRGPSKTRLFENRLFQISALPKLGSSRRLSPALSRLKV